LENPRGISQSEMLIRPAHLHACHYSKHILEMSAAASILFTEVLKTQFGNVCNCKHSVYRNAQNTVWKCLQLQAFCLPKCSKHSVDMSAAASILFTEMLKTQFGNVCTCKHSVYRNAVHRFFSFDTLRVPIRYHGIFFYKKIKIVYFYTKAEKRIPLNLGRPICNPWGPMFQHLLIS
jgi:hypothetical protein